MSVSKIITYCYCLLFLFFVAKYAVNLPYQDDANLLEITIPGIGFKAFFQNLFSADSDHIQAIPKLTTYFQYKIFGEVNFYWLTIWVNILVIITLFLLVRFNKTNRIYYYYLPLFFLILQPQIHEISFWVLPGLQHAYALLFLVLSVFFLDINKKYNLLSLFFAACATFCTGNGLIAFISIIYIFILYRKPVWYALVAFVMSLSVYLYMYKPSAAVRERVEFSSILNFNTLFWASPIEVFNRMHLQVGMGALVILFSFFLFIFVSIKIFLQKNKEALPQAKLLAILIFCGGTGLLISLSREYDIIFSRFQYYSLLGWAIIYLLVIEIIQNSVRKYFAILAGICFTIICLFSYYANFQKIENTSNSYLADTFNWKNHKTMLMVDQPFLALAYKIYDKTNDITYNPTNDLITKSLFKTLIETASKNPIFTEIDLEILKDKFPRKYFFDEHFLLVSNNFNYKKKLTDQWYLVFSNKQNSYILAPQFNHQFKAEFIESKQYYEQGFLCYLPTFNFRPEIYDIYLLDAKSKKAFKTHLFIDFRAKIPIVSYR